MYAVLTYGFPLILIGFEWGLRQLMEVDSSQFIGPTLAAAALSFLIPLTRPKRVKLSDENLGYVAVNARDQHFIPVVWLFVLVGLFAWSASCYFSANTSQIVIFSLPIYTAIGLGAYFASLILVMIKEAL